MNTEDSNAISIGELVRVVARMEQTLSSQQQLYLLSSVYRAEQTSADRRLDQLERDAEQERRDRKAMFRLVLASFVLPAVLLLVQILSVTTRGAAT